MVRPLRGANQAMSLMAGLLWAVAALIVGSVIYLSALERTRDFAVFKAVGVATRSIMAGLAMQAVAVALLAALLGAGLSLAARAARSRCAATCPPWRLSRCRSSPS